MSQSEPPESTSSNSVNQNPPMDQSSQPPKDDSASNSDRPVDRLAKEILGEFEPRYTTLERMLARFRPLRPPVATSTKFFDYFELPDPYHPLILKKQQKLELGSTSLVLGENRRPVARHATVPELSTRVEKPKAPPPPPQAFRPQGVPEAKRTTPPPPPPKPPEKKSSGEFGNRSTPGLVGKLPIRPGLQNSTTDSNTSPSEQSVMKRELPKIPQSMPSKMVSSKNDVSQSGMMRMKRSHLQNTQPIVRDLNPSTDNEFHSHSLSAESIQDIPSENRNIGPAMGAGGLDDLFGFGNQNEGRMKLPKRNQPSGNSSKVQSFQGRNPNLPPEVSPVTVPKTQANPTSNPVSSTSSPVKDSVPKTADESITRSIGPAMGAGGLDDLFGFGNQNEGRMKLPKRNPNDANKK